jgi:hypothetical protein
MLLRKSAQVHESAGVEVFGATKERRESAYAVENEGCSLSGCLQKRVKLMEAGIGNANESHAKYELMRGTARMSARCINHYNIRGNSVLASAKLGPYRKRENCGTRYGRIIPFSIGRGDTS